MAKSSGGEETAGTQMEVLRRQEFYSVDIGNKNLRWKRNSGSHASCNSPQLKGNVIVMEKVAKLRQKLTFKFGP